jgi:predicted RNA-binding Zn-ribbon protein involved in translation (DUF1610 family)
VKTNMMEGLMKAEFDGRWSELGREAMKEVKQWRLSHPKASLDEIERALDEQLGRLRARMLEDLAQASDAARLNEQTAERLRCPQCDEELISRGQQVRELETNHDQRLCLDRTYASCPRCGVGFFPPG